MTGGAGFIGSHIVKKGLELGHEMTVVDDFSTGNIDNLAGLNIKLMEGDIGNVNLMKNAAKGKDGVFHLAASVGNIKSFENPHIDLRVNYAGTLNVLEAVRNNEVPLLIFSSSSAVYGESGNERISEDDCLSPSSPYGISKTAGEFLCRVYGKKYGVRTVSLRYFNVYGTYQRYDHYSNAIPIFVHYLRDNIPLVIYGDGRQTRDFIHVLDVANLNWKFAEHGKIEGCFNVGTGQSTSILDLVSLLQEVSGIENPGINFLPARTGEVKNSRANITKLLNSINYQPFVSLKEGVSSYWKWSGEV